MSEREDLAKRVLDSVTSIMDFQEGADGGRLWWCHCFGGVLEYVADKTFTMDYDIDLGVLYSECNTERLISAFEGHGYKTDVKLINDVSKQPLNIHFKPKEDFLSGTPTIDVFLWYEHKGFLYHTYDVKKQGSKVPSEYVLKGVPKEWLAPDQETIDKERNIGHPERAQLLTDRGTWKFPVFEAAGSLSMRLPFMVGHLLDEWYSPSWRFREYYKGQSMSRWVKKIKSFKELK